MQYSIAFRYLFGAILLALSILLSCDEGEDGICRECSGNNLIREFDNESFQLSISSEDTAVLFKDTGDTTIYYGVCNSEIVKGIDFLKVLNITGSEYQHCKEREWTTLMISEYSIVHVCLPEIDTLEQEYNLAGKWQVYEVRTDSSYHPPCEYESAVIEISEFGGLRISLNPTLIAYGGQIEIDSSSANTKEGVMTISSLKTPLYVPDTDSGIRFALEVCKAIGGCSSERVVINYELDHNFLMLANPNNGSSIILYQIT